MVTREEFYVDSVDGIHMIHGFRWYNTDKAYKGVIQVVHGMLEYIERYDEFAKAMAENGYFATLWDESKRLINPQVVHVDLSQKLYDLKQELLHNYGREKL